MLKNYEALFPTLNNKCKLFLGDGFRMEKRGGDGYRLVVYRSQGFEKAVNRLDNNEDSEVNVYHWFDNYYIYVEVKLIFENKVPQKKKNPVRGIVQCSLSLSVFKSLSGTITQLFRAEWDDYGNEQNRHPQPHWHVTCDTAVSNTFEEHAEKFKEEGFLALLEPEKEQISSLKKFHFAMKLNWGDESTHHTTTIDSSEQVSDWFICLLKSIKEELDYIDK